MESFRKFIYIVRTFGLPLIREIVSYVKFRQNENLNVQLTIQAQPSRNVIIRSQNLPIVVLGNSETRNTRRQIRNRQSKLRKKIRRRNRMLNSVPAV